MGVAGRIGAASVNIGFRGKTARPAEGGVAAMTPALLGNAAQGGDFPPY